MAVDVSGIFGAFGKLKRLVCHFCDPGSFAGLSSIPRFGIQERSWLLAFREALAAAMAPLFRNRN
jgi:hypothetical protein